MQILALLFTLWPLSVLPESSHQPAADLSVLNFPNSGLPVAQQPFLAGVHALHNFWYEEARDNFRQAQRLDPGFGLAYWGEAMTHDNALLYEPGFDNEELGSAMLERIAELIENGQLRLDERERA